jgi:hypothetical protein
MANELSVASTIPLKTPEIISDKFSSSIVTGGTGPVVFRSTATSSQLASLVGLILCSKVKPLTGDL